MVEQKHMKTNLGQGGWNGSSPWDKNQKPIANNIEINETYQIEKPEKLEKNLENTQEKR